MTAVAKKIHKFTEDKTKLVKGADTAGVIICLFLSVSRTRAQWADIPFYFLAIVLISACKDVFYKSVMATGAVVAFGIMAVGDIFRLPYMLGCILYIVCFNYTGEKWRLKVCVAGFAAAKIVLYCLSRPFRYTIYTIIECCSTLPRRAPSGQCPHRSTLRGFCTSAP